MKMAGWMETFAQRGGQLVIHGAAVADLDYFSRAYDLVLVAAGKGELVSMFERDASRSPYSEPQRALAVAYVHGMDRARSTPTSTRSAATWCPGVGELFVMPTYTHLRPGRHPVLGGHPRRPPRRLQGGEGPGRAPVPHPGADGAVHALGVRAGHQGRADGRGRHARRPLRPDRAQADRPAPRRRAVLGVADVVVANDPITGQGSNSASKCAATYLAADPRARRQAVRRGVDAADVRPLLEHRPARHQVDERHAGVPPEHVLNLIGSGEQFQPVADRFANAFNNPADFENFFYEPEKTDAYLAEVAGAAAADGAGPAPHDPVRRPAGTAPVSRGG